MKRVDAYFVGRMGLKYDEKSKSFVFIEVDAKNALDLKNGDEFVSIENIPVTEANLEEIWDKYLQNNSTISSLTMTVKRDGVEKTLTGPLYKGYGEVKHYLNPVISANPSQTETLAMFMSR